MESATQFVDTAFIGLCLFCANLLFLRKRDTGVFMPLAALFLIQGLSSLGALIADASGSEDEFNLVMRVSVLVVLFDFASPFLFWLYVRALTSEADEAHKPRLRYHLPAIIISGLLMSSLMFLPTDLSDVDLPEDDPRLLRFVLIALAVLVADVLFRIIMAVYLILIIRMLMTYRKRLREVFASTENRELTWVWVITLAAMSFWFLSAAVSILTVSEAVGFEVQDELLDFLESLALLFLFWVIGIWGLRQRPGLTRTPVSDPPDPDEPSERKYKKSALDEERAARIAKKIETAMSQDLLYREPNLSLWDLAKHIGVTSHYVSQTLNAKLNSTFFDYINRWRINDAIEQLTSTDETILNIAYDVGFNSRSAFYKAFKRETGKTPSDVRN
ncbi:MAG: helix-turn-helix transcriptional regulator [Pseudomonadota bacterium]